MRLLYKIYNFQILIFISGVTITAMKVSDQNNLRFRVYTYALIAQSKNSFKSFLKEGFKRSRYLIFDFYSISEKH